KPMRFELAGNGGNCGGCEWISAQGTIEENTAREFKNFVVREKLAGIRIEVTFNSPGGLLGPGLDLGLAIRQLRFDTEVERGGICASACAYAFLGGVSRGAERGQIGVHQFYSPDLADPKKIALNAENEKNMQALVGTLALYTYRMGVNPSFLFLASSTDAR